MKIFHLSDLHIGIRLFNRDLKEDQTYIFHQIISCAKQEKPDAIVIAGDIYDKAVPVSYTHLRPENPRQRIFDGDDPVRRGQFDRG